MWFLLPNTECLDFLTYQWELESWTKYIRQLFSYPEQQAVLGFQGWVPRVKLDTHVNLMTPQLSAFRQFSRCNYRSRDPINIPAKIWMEKTGEVGGQGGL